MSMGFPGPKLMCRDVDLSHALDRDLARFLVHVLAARELLLDDIDLRDVLEPARPFSALETNDTAHDFGDALKHHQAPS
jgi:hypothetical protein